MEALKVVDELMTPGCPQCAVKHLSAALHHVAKANGSCEPLAADPYMVEVCTAYINLVEVRAGYHSHLWYAVGALVRAEEHMAPRGKGGCVAREARLMLEQSGEEAVLDALNCICGGAVPDHADWATAHFDEARRELPAFAHEMRMDDLIGSIERVREEFFPKNDDLAEAMVAPEEETTNEGEPEMATAKKAAPAAKKGTKCADKGGATKKTATKACAKGGKCKK